LEDKWPYKLITNQ
jgi:hypothetical protein